MAEAQYVGPRNDPDGLTAETADRQGRDGGKVVTGLHGTYYEQSSRGRLYTGSSASGGIALIVPATTGGHPTLWNPSGSGVYISVVRLELSYVSGANAPTAIEWASVANTGASIGTGAPIATATVVAPTGVIGGPLGNSANPQAKWSPTTNSFTAAPVFVRTTGIALFTGVAATAAPPFLIDKFYDGDMLIAPGNAICLCSQAATTTALFQVSITWEEVPV